MTAPATDTNTPPATKIPKASMATISSPSPPSTVTLDISTADRTETATPFNSNQTLVHTSQMAASLPTPPTSSENTPKTSTCTARTKTDGVDNTVEFTGTVSTDNSLPSLKTLRKIADYPILDGEGKSVPFKSLYSGPNCPRRVLVIFVRHFFCGNCQEYIRTLSSPSSSLSPSSLLTLPTPTSIAIIGCGAPSLIAMYRSVTSCPFPIFADPTKSLYLELGMQRTLNLGERPEYQRKVVLSLAFHSFWQAMRVLKSGDTFKGGDMQQVGGEFLFESENSEGETPSPAEENKELGDEVEERVTWCHRMRNTRDHAEIPELREVLGLDPEEGGHGGNEERWQKALSMRKGTGLSGGGERSLSVAR